MRETPYYKMEKSCKTCNIVKSIDEFGKRKQSNKTYIKLHCKKCEYGKLKERRRANVQKTREINNRYINKNREKAREWNRKHFRNNKERVRERARNNYKKYRQIPQFKIMQNCRNRINKLIKRSSESQRTHNLLGCSPLFLRNWLEHQFNSKMNWNNYGSYWDIEHVMPCAFYDLEKVEEQQSCFNWRNLRPYESSLNKSKNDKIMPFQILMQELIVHFYDKL